MRECDMQDEYSKPSYFKESEYVRCGLASRVHCFKGQ